MNTHRKPRGLILAVIAGALLAPLTATANEPAGLDWGSPPSLTFEDNPGKLLAFELTAPAVEPLAFTFEPVESAITIAPPTAVAAEPSETEVVRIDFEELDRKLIAFRAVLNKPDPPVPMLKASAPTLFDLFVEHSRRSPRLILVGGASVSTGRT